MRDEYVEVCPFPLRPLSSETEDLWDSWVPTGHFTMSYGFLTSARDIEMPGYKLEPLFLSDAHGADRGVAASYRNLLDGAELGDATLQKRVRQLRRFFPHLLWFNVLEIGNPAALAFPVRSDLSPGASLRALASWGMQQAKRGEVELVVIRDFDEAGDPKIAALLEELDFQQVQLPALFNVPLGFGSFADYRAAMRTRYRSRLDTCMVATSDLRIELLSDFADLAPELHRLWRDLFNRAARYHKVVLTERFFAAVSRLPNTRLLLLRRPDSSIAGFGLLFLDGPVLRYSATGFTRDAALNEGVYFRMLYEVIRFGIDNGFSMANLGATTAGPKMSVGGQPVHLHAWMWHPSSLHRRALGWLTHRLMRPVAPVERNVFRAPVRLDRDPALAEESFAPERLSPSAAPASETVTSDTGVAV